MQFSHLTGSNSESLANTTITPSGPTTFCEGGSGDAVGCRHISWYVWSTTDVTETILVTASDTYTVTVTDGNGCSSATSQAVTVNPLPTPTILPSGPTTFCEGGSVTLDAGVFSSYVCSTTITNGTPVTASGTYTVTVTDGNGCSSATSQAVTVNALPTPTIVPSGSTTFCEGGSVTLDAGVFSSYVCGTTDVTETILVTASGTYPVTVTDGNGCSSATSQAVTVNPLPTPTITPSGSTTL